MAATRTTQAKAAVDAVIVMLRERGCRITPQREMIVEEVLVAKGHFTVQSVTERVQSRSRAVNPSTVYRTIELLEDVGVVRHSHQERAAEYHRTGESDHVHLSCTQCGATDDLSSKEAALLRRAVRKHNGFLPYLSHFAISGSCAACQAAGA